MKDIKPPKFIGYSFSGIPSEKPFISEKENNKNLEMVVVNWHLGPEKTSIYPKDNKQFWNELSKAWSVTESEARRRFCANCEYFDNTPEMMAKMEKIPLNDLDKDGGGRGYCNKFDFICHNLRTCQAWEKKECESED